MDESRAQAYLNLIQLLLSCPAGEEGELLQEHSEFVDSGLIEVMQQVASRMAADGEQNAGFLQQLAGQISQVLAAGTQGGNAERNSAYLQLILALMDCPTGEEIQILLNASSDLIDAGLVQAMAEVAASLQETGNENVADFLTQLATQLVEVLELAYGNNFQLQFLMQVLQATKDSNGDPNAVYPLLQDNLNLLNDNFALVLQDWGAQTLENSNTQDLGASIVRVIGSFSNLICQFPLGSKASNLEIAIAGIQITLTVFTREDYPQEWAASQNNLGIAYFNRIRGKKAENLEMAIATCEAALTVYTRDAFPQEWTKNQINFGNAYFDRILGEKAENLEMAIAAYEAALTVCMREAFPQDWAGTKNNLGNAYLYRIRAEKAENLEMAIEAYEAALTVRTREAFPQDWAGTKNNLANAYRDRILGEKSENLEKAIAACEAALSIYTREAFPQYWGITQDSLGNAYRDRILGEKAENLEKAIAAYEAALIVRTRDAFPQDWAKTQMNFGNVYTQRIRAEKAENLEKAIAAYEAALSIYTREAFPQYWAMIQHNLATAYSNRILGEKAENSEKAIAACEGALTVRTREAFPLNNAQTLFNLGLAYRKVPNLQLAHDTFADAINTVELLRGEIYSGDETKQKLAEEWNNLYLSMVEVCIELKNYTAAIEYAERSKARNLVELLATRDLYPKGDIPETVLNELSRLRREIDAEQRRVDIEQTNRNNNGGRISGERSPQIDNLQTTIRDQSHLIQLRQQLNELIVRDIKPIDPDFALTQEVKGISYSEIQSLTAENTAILQWYITSDRFLAFIIIPESSSPIVWQSSKTDFKALENWFNEYLKDYQENKTQWQQNLASRLQSLADILHLNDLLGRVSKQCNQLILIPHRYLHLFPLHALPVSRETWQRFNSETPSPEPTNPCLLDCFKQSVRYAPSCQLLQQAQRRERPNFTQLFAVQNPNKDLEFTDVEVQAIRQNFPPENQDILIQNNAQKSVIDDSRLSIAHCAHFSCHGYFNFQQPLLSALLLADSELLPPVPAESNPNRYQPLENGNILDLDKCLTLADIFALDFRECRLVVLSACETGISDFNSISDEYISLASGFLVAGSSSVVSTLWAVNDLSTSLLMIEFYQNLKAGLSVALALNNAQLWLRDVTVEKLQQWASKLSIRPSLKEDLYDMLDNLDSTEQPPFQSPYHWAAFCATGQ